MPRPLFRTLLALSTLASLAACSSSDTSSGVTDTGTSADLGIDAVDAPDTPPAIDATDVLDVARPCTSNADCAGNPLGGACDTTTGRCVTCVAMSDTCPPAQHCDDPSHTCVPGCRNDEGCRAGGGDAGAEGGVGAMAYCLAATHACVECVADEHCPPGLLCVGNTCTTGCNATHGCPSGQSCCAGACVDPLANVAHCGGCDMRCTIVNGTPACVNGACAVRVCTAPYADCNHAVADGCESNTMTDVTNCGGCGTACPARAHATTTCTAGGCGFTCDAGFADCDANPANGCETDTRADPNHCGSCATRCNPPHGTAGCTAGVCAIAACDTGYGDCDANPTNGCETDTTGTVMHCGGCGMACPSRPHALAGCAASTCVIACLAGFADCNGDPADGCEIDTRVGLLNCGGCGHVCVFPHAAASCMAGACTMGACDMGFGNCDGDAMNGCETDLTRTATDCGTCGHVCPAVPHATPQCTAGVCGFACTAGFGDCNGNAADGCEAVLATDPANCGACGTTCSSGVCVAGACAAPTCMDTVRNGMETDTDCGGPTCRPCGYCAHCAMPRDCQSSTCSTAGRCVFRADVSIDWFTTCHGPGGPARDVVVSSMPMGTYLVTPTGGGATVWDPPYTPPSSGWFWYITCERFVAPGLVVNTPQANAAAAYAGVAGRTALVSFAGGDLRCYFSDSQCVDNHGSVDFRVELSCP